MQEPIHNDRVIGGMTARCSEEAVALYKLFVEGDCVITNARTAEMAKLTENSFRDVNIAFANELSMICDKLDIDVWELIALANRHPRVNILQPGPGGGGHCIAVDPWFIVSKTPEEARLIRTAREVNDAKPDWVVEMVRAAVGAYLLDNPDKTARDVTIAVYGLTFKADIDDLRESPALQIAQALAKNHPGRLLTVDPNVPSEALFGEGITIVDEATARREGEIHVALVDHTNLQRAPRPGGQLIDTRALWR